MTGGDILVNRARNALADAGQRDQALDPLRLHELGDVSPQVVERIGGVQVSINPKRVGLLRSQQLRDLTQPGGYFVVERPHLKSR